MTSPGVSKKKKIYIYIWNNIFIKYDKYRKVNSNIIIWNITSSNVFEWWLVVWSIMKSCGSVTNVFFEFRCIQNE